MDCDVHVHESPAALAPYCDRPWRTSLETVSARTRSTLPYERPRALRNVWFPIRTEPVSLTVVVGAIMPLLSPATAVISLKVEPGA